MIKGISFLGVRTDNIAAMSQLYSDVFRLKQLHESPGFAAFAAENGDRIELFSLDYPDHEHFGVSPVGGFEVDDVEAAHTLLKQVPGVEVLSGIMGKRSGTRWVHFRAPDGNVYEVVHHASSNRTNVDNPL